MDLSCVGSAVRVQRVDRQGHCEIPHAGYELSDSEQDTYSEVWRLECEARLLLTLPLDKRRDYLEKVKKARRQPLQDEMRRQWTENHGSVAE